MLCLAVSSPHPAWRDAPVPAALGLPRRRGAAGEAEPDPGESADSQRKAPVLHRVRQKQVETSGERWAREGRRSSRKLGQCRIGAKRQKPGAQSRAAAWSETSSHGRLGDSRPAKASGSLQTFPLWDRRGGDGEGASWAPLPLGFRGRHPKQLRSKAAGDSRLSRMLHKQGRSGRRLTSRGSQDGSPGIRGGPGRARGHRRLLSGDPRTQSAPFPRGGWEGTVLPCWALHH